jgi:integrase
MPTLLLTDASCRSIAAAAGQPRTDYFDSKVRGLALRVTGPSAKAPQGYKTFTVTYRIGGVQKRATMEPRFPELGLAEARTRARGMLAEAKGGIDPAAPREVRRHTFADVYARSYKLLETKGSSVSYLRGQRTAAEKYLLPKWRDRPIVSITKAEGAEIVETIFIAGLPAEAIHVRKVIARIFDYAVNAGILEASVMAKLKNPAKETKRERVLTEAELRAVWRLAGTLGYPWGPYLRMLMLTLQRRCEVSGLPWVGELDAEMTLWTCPPERRQKNDKENLVPLAAAVRSDLAGCRRRGAYVFMSSWAARGRPIGGFSKFKEALDRELAEAGRPIADWTFHDLRRTGATYLGERLGVDHDLIERILGHTIPGVRGTYQRGLYLEQKREALDRWAEYLMSLAA